MNRSITQCLVALAGVLFIPVQASAATVDFENNISSPSPFVYESNGFRFMNGQLVAGSLQVGDPGCGGCLTLDISVESISGDEFNLGSLDILVGSLFPSASITGVYAGGGNISRSVSTAGWQTEAFGAAWNGLDSLSISMNSASGVDVLGLDNFTATVVPVPAAVWLFGSALAGLGWMRRRS